MRRVRKIALACALVAAQSAVAFAEDDAELQKQLANPVADLVTVPIQYTANFNVGPESGTQDVVNIQPVYPTKLGPVNLINRLIVPLLSNPPAAFGQDRVGGLGDILYEGFFAPAKPGAMIWGAGPLIMLDSATNDRLGTGKYGAGPAVVVLTQNGPWSVGALITQLWSFAGDDSRAAVSQFQFQPVLSYTISPKHSIGYAGTISANWHQPGSQIWTVPVGATYSMLTHPGSIPVNFIFGGGYNVVRPTGAGDWFLRLQINMIFAKK
ncbi:MAG TPA: hypothetical protein VLW26_03735 [Steroidobacteraceae bacterium]|nr:hypothetical protein [Steroidobacteraceae bacterium]